MKTLAELCRRLLDAGVRGPWIRGRVHKISIVAGGEVSVVIRFGIDEPQARQLTQGALVEIQEVDHVEVQQQGKGGSGQT
jgi:hypothetical protein